MADFPISSLPSKTPTSDTLLLGSMPDGDGGYDSGKFDAQDISGIVVKHMTQTDYDDLSPAEKNNGTLYITDGTPPSEAVTGSDVLYFSDVSDSNKPKSTTAAAVANLVLGSLKIIKTGKANYTGLKGGGYADRVTVPITFDEPMPNASYVAFAMINDAYSDFPFIRIYPFLRSTTGFTATCINQSGSATAVSGTFDWVVIG